MTFRAKQALDFWLGGLLLLLLFLPVRGLGLLLRRDHSVAGRRGCAVIKLVGAGSLFLAIPSLQAFAAGSQQENSSSSVPVMSPGSQKALAGSTNAGRSTIPACSRWLPPSCAAFSRSRGTAII
jgi:ABC-type phosphate transport system substrate-binding protein